MFVILLTYQKPLEEVDAFLALHRSFLDEGYTKGYLLASGPRTPRTGGVLLSSLDERKTLENFLARDPFAIHGIGSYEIIQFTPVKGTQQFYAAIDHAKNTNS